MNFTFLTAAHFVEERVYRSFFAHLLTKNRRDKPPDCPLIICKFATVSRERLTLRDMAPRLLIPLGRGRLVTVIILCR